MITYSKPVIDAFVSKCNDLIMEYLKNLGQKITAQVAPFMLDIVGLIVDIVDIATSHSRWPRLTAFAFHAAAVVTRICALLKLQQKVEDLSGYFVAVLAHLFGTESQAFGDVDITRLLKPITTFLTVLIGMVIPGVSARELAVYSRISSDLGGATSDILRNVIDMFKPTDTPEDLSDRINVLTRRADELLAQPLPFFAKTGTTELQALVDEVQGLLRLHHLKSPEFKFIFDTLSRKMMSLNLKIREVGELGSNVGIPRQIPVQITFVGERGHGKTFALNKLYEEICRLKGRMLGVHTIQDTPDNFAPPFSNEEFLIIDEYLATHESTAISMMNNLISSTPMFQNSAFVKFMVPKFKFVACASNIAGPEKIESKQANWHLEMQRAFWSRHNFFKVVQPDFDDTRGRHEQVRRMETQFFPGRLVDRGALQTQTVEWSQHPLTLAQVAEWAVDQEAMFAAKYENTMRERQELIEEVTAPAQAQAAGSPKVLLIHGPPGTGKTQFMENYLSQWVSSQGSLVKFKTIPDYIPTEKFIVLDDCAQHDLKAYKHLYDNLESNQVLINIMNLMTPTHRWRTSNTIGIKVDEEHYLRRLGLTQPCWWGWSWYTPPVAPNMEIQYQTDRVLVDGRQIAGDPIPELDGLITRFTSGLTLIKGSPPVEMTFDLELTLDNHPGSLREAIAEFRRGNIRVKENNGASITKLENLLGVVARVPQETASQMVADHCDRQGLSLILRIAEDTYAYKNGTMWTTKRESLLEETDPGVYNYHDFARGGAVTIMTRDQIKSVIVDNIYPPGFTLAAKARLRRAIEQRISPHLCATWTFETQVRNAFSAFASRMRDTAQHIMAFVNEHPIISAIIGATSILLGSVALWHFLGEEQKAHSQSLNDKAVKAVVRRSTPQSEETAKRTTVVKSVPHSEEARVKPAVVRAKPQSEQNNKTAALVKRHSVMDKQTPTIVKKVESHSVNGFQGIQTWSPQLSHMFQKVEDAIGYVQSASGATVCGIPIRDNLILSVAHVVMDMQESFTFHTSRRDGKDPRAWNMVPFQISRSRELALFKVTDHKYPPAKDITKYFVKESDLGTIGQTVMQFCDSQYNTLVGGYAVLRLRTQNGEYMDPRAPAGFNPTQCIFTIDYATVDPQFPLPKKGTCGSPLYRTDGISESRVLCGIHIGYSHLQLKGLVSLVTQEDIAALSSAQSFEDVTPYSCDISFGGVDFVMHQEYENMIGDVIVEDFDLEIDETDRTHPVGFSQSSYVPAEKGKTTAHRTPISQYLKTPNLKSPAHFSSRGLTEEAKRSLRKCGVHPSIGATQLSKIEGPEVAVSKPIFAQLVANMTALLLNLPHIDDFRPLNMFETINGTKHLRKPWASNLDRIKMDKSPGAPYTKIFKCRTKGDMFVQPGGEGTPYQIALNRAGCFLREQMQLIENAWLTGQRPFRVIEGHLKAETLPHEKANSGGTRMFLLEPVDMFMVQKKYLGILQALHQHSRVFNSHHTIGLNPYLELPEMMKFYRGKGKVGTDADYKRYDKLMPGFAWDVVRDAIINVALHLKHTNPEGPWKTFTDEHIKASYFGLFRDLKEHMYLYAGNYLWTKGDMPSGTFPTNLGDSWLNDVMTMYQVFRCIDYTSDARSLLRLKDGEYPSYQVIVDSIMWWNTNGDDEMDVLLPIGENIITFEKRQQAASEVGMVMTPASKGDVIRSVVPLEELQFNGRIFVPTPSGYRVPLRESSMSGMLHWTEQTGLAQFEAQMLSFYYELTQYSDDEVQAFLADIRQACNRANIPHHHRTLEDIRRLEAQIRSDECSIVWLGDENEIMTRYTESQSFESVPSVENRTDSHADQCEEEAPTTLKDQRKHNDRYTSTSTEGREDSTSIRLLPGKGIDGPRLGVSTKGLEEVSPKGKLAVQGGCGALMLSRGEIPCSVSNMTSNNNNNKQQTHFDYETLEDWLRDWSDWKIKFLSDPDFKNIFELLKQEEFYTVPRVYQPRRAKVRCYCGYETSLQGLQGHIRNEHGGITKCKALDSRIWAKWSCIQCGATPVGIEGLLIHVVNSHGHDVNATLIEAEKQVDPPKVDLEHTTEAQMFMPDPSASGASAPPRSDPASEAAGFIQGQTISRSALSGAEAGTQMMDPGALGVTVMSVAKSLRPSMIPMEEGFRTGQQYDYRDRALGAWAEVANVTVSSSSTAGTTIAKLPLYNTCGRWLRDYMLQHEFVAGSMEYRIVFSASSTFQGSLLVSDLERTYAENLMDIDFLLTKANEILPLNGQNVSTTYALHDAKSNAQVRKVADVLQPFPDGGIPEIRLTVYQPLSNPFDGQTQVQIKILARPGEDFRLWGPVGESLNTSAAPDEAVYEFEEPVYVYIEGSNEPRTAGGDKTGRVITDGTDEWLHDKVLPVYEEAIKRMGQKGGPGPYTNYIAAGNEGSKDGVLSINIGELTDALDLTNHPRYANINGNMMKAQSGFKPDEVLADFDANWFTYAPAGYISNTTEKTVGEFPWTVYVTSDENSIVYSGWGNIKELDFSKKDVATAVFGTQATARDRALSLIQFSRVNPPRVASDLLENRPTIWTDLPCMNRLEKGLGFTSFVDGTLLTVTIDDTISIPAVKFGRGLFVNNDGYLHGNRISKIKIKTVGSSGLGLPTPFSPPPGWVSSIYTAGQKRKTLGMVKKEKVIYDMQTEAHAGAAIGTAISGGLGGLFGGLGQYFGQKMQNDWWEEQFEKNRGHESEMSAQSAKQAREQAKLEARLELGKNMAVRNARAVLSGSTRPGTAGDNRKTPTSRTMVTQPNGQRSVGNVKIGRTPAPLRDPRPISIIGTPVPKSTAMDAAGLPAMPPTTVAPQDMAQQGPMGGPPPTNVQYHAAAFSGSSQLNPTSMASAGAPFMESSKMAVPSNPAKETK